MTDRRSGWVRWLAPWVGAHRRAAIAALAGAVVGMVATTFVPVVQKVIVDDVIVAGDRALAPWMVVLAGIGVVRFAATVTRRLAGGSVAYRVQEDLRNAVFDHVMRLDLAQHDALPAGQLVSRANTDVQMVFGVLQMVAMVAGNVVMLIMSLVIMALLSPLLAVVALVALAATFAVAWRMRHDVYLSTWDASQREAAMTTAAEEAIVGVRVVKGLGQQGRTLDRFTARVERLFGGRVRNVRIKARFTALLQGLPALSQVAVLAVGGWLALDGQLSIGTLLACFTYLTQLSAPARMLAVFLAASQQARAGVARLRVVLETEPTLGDRTTGTAGSAARTVGSGSDVSGRAGTERSALDATTFGRVEFDGVTFGYGDGPDVLVDFSLTVEPGERVALVGASGSGKSTATLLIPRSYDVRAGTVRVDGRDVRDQPLALLREAVGTVFEEAFLFSGTVADNIRYGRPDTTDDEVEQAARIAQCHEFITALPRGYDTPVGEAGVALSGGQRQRIALARTLVREPRILILDDATSSVDAGVEAAIHRGLDAYLQGRTAVLVAHRASTLALANRVVVLEGGRIVDEGSHVELLARNAHYRSLMAVVDLGGEDGAAPVHAAAAARPATAPLAGPDDALAAAVAELPAIRDDWQIDPVDHHPDRGGLDFRRFVRRWRRELGVAVGCVALDSLATLALPILIRAGIDRGVVEGVGRVVGIVSAAALGVVLVALWAMWMENLVAGRAAERMLAALRIRLFAHLQRLGLDFYERERTGRLLSRLTADVDTLSELLQSGLVNAAMSAAMLLGMIVVLALLNLPLALSVFAVTVPLVLATRVYQRASRRAYDRQRDATAVVLAELQERVSGVRVIQALGQQERASHAFHAVDATLRDAGLAALRVQIGYFVLVEFLSVAGIMVVLGHGSVLHDQGRLTVGALVAFLLYVTQFFGPIQQMSQVFDSWQRAAAGLRKLDGFLATRPSVTDPAVPVDAPRGPGRIQLADVRFRYPGAVRDALGPLTLDVAAGEHVAIVGETGSGKTTLAKLIARFYDPGSGTIRLDGIDVAAFAQGDLRRRIGSVPQEPFLFGGTIRDNLVFGDPDLDDDQLDAAIDQLGIRSLIDGLPGGLDHVVVERGRSLSTGERQLLCLARALLADPTVLVLDEATSNLDLASEARITRAVEVLSRRRTSLIIAHRLSTAARADRVLVMDAGRIVQDGPHAALVEVPGPYRDLWKIHEAIAGAAS